MNYVVLSCSNYSAGSHVISSQDENLQNKGKLQKSEKFSVRSQDLRHLLECLIRGNNNGSGAGALHLSNIIHSDDDDDGDGGTLRFKQSDFIGC